MKRTCQICILIRMTYFGPLRWLRAKPDSNEQPWTQTLHLSLRELPSLRTVFCFALSNYIQINTVVLSKWRLEGRQVGSSLIPLLCLWGCLETLTFLLGEQLTDYSFPARQILLLPAAIEDIDVCMNERYICHPKFVEFLYKASRTGIYYICLAPTEWARSISPEPEEWRPISFEGLPIHISAVNNLPGSQGDILLLWMYCNVTVRAQSVTVFLKGFVLHGPPF